MPIPPWLVLSLGALLAIGYMVAQAAAREGLPVQGDTHRLRRGIHDAGLLVILVLNHPYAATGGMVTPTEMRRTLTLRFGDAHLDL